MDFPNQVASRDHKKGKPYLDQNDPYGNQSDLDTVNIFVYFRFMKTINFYRTASGKCPVIDHLETLTDVQAKKVAWVL
jgi:hypothetical protein